MVDKRTTTLISKSTMLTLTHTSQSYDMTKKNVDFSMKNKKKKTSRPKCNQLVDVTKL